MAKLARFQDGIPIVANDTERGTLFASPATDQRVFNKTSGNIERYTGSAWVPDFARGGLATYNVKQYGAKGDGSTDDIAALQAARDAAQGAGGGVLYFPRGQYVISETLTLDVTSTNSIHLVGEGKRDTLIYINDAGATAVRVGASSPDASGTTDSATYYGVIADLTIHGSLAPDGRGLYMVEPHRWTVRDVNVEGFSSAGGIGIELRGSTTSGGVGASAAPHAWRNGFYSVTVATCRRPLLMVNCDENDFYNCQFALPPSLSGLSANSVHAIEIQQGRNNRFFGTLLSGRSTADADREAYVGVKLATPTNGDTLNNQFYGLVAEGFNRPIWVESSTVRGTMVVGYNSSINAVEFLDGGAQTGSGTVIWAPYHHLNFQNTRAPYNDALSFTDADTTPSVQKGNLFATANTGSTSITTFDDGKNGQTIIVRLDANTTLVNGASLFLRNSQNIVGKSNRDLVVLTNVNGTWQEVARSMPVWNAQSFADADTTPSVLGGQVFATANTGATSITTFDDGVSGQILHIRVDGNTTLVHGATLKLAGGSNFTGTANDMISIANVAGTWYEIARSVNG